MSNPKQTRAFIVVTSLFFMWGLITVLVDFLIPRLREIFEIGNFQAGLVQFAFFIAYGLLSIPAGFLLKRIGYKKGIILGLVVMGTGCALFYPAAASRVFPLFLIAYFTLAGGMTILQVAANPYVAVLGDPDKASSRLNLAQAFNSLGTAIAPILGAIFILSDNILSKNEISALSDTERYSYFLQEASAVQMPFIILAAITLALAVAVVFSPLPQVLTHAKNSGGYKSVLSNPTLRFGAICIFLYVGAEVAVGSFLTNYFMDMNLAENIRQSSLMTGIFNLINSGDIQSIDAKGVVGAFVFFYWTGAMIGRFVGSYLTRIMNPGKVLAFFGSGAIVLILISMSTTGFVSMWSILAVGLFNSIMFPTIFALAIKDLGELKPQGSGVLCTAIMGGAFIPPLFGLAADQFSFKMAFIVVLVCYAVILIFGRYSARTNRLLETA